MRWLHIVGIGVAVLVVLAVAFRTMRSVTTTNSPPAQVTDQRMFDIAQTVVQSELQKVFDSVAHDASHAPPHVSDMPPQQPQHPATQHPPANPPQPAAVQQQPQMFDAVPANVTSARGEMRFGDDVPVTAERPPINSSS